VQNYNTLLTLSHLLDSTDGIVLVRRTLDVAPLPSPERYWVSHSLRRGCID